MNLPTAPPLTHRYLSNPYVHRPATEVTTYTAQGSEPGAAERQVPLPLTFNGGELEVGTDGDEQVYVKQGVMNPPPSPRVPPPPSPAPPPPFEMFSDGVCTGRGMHVKRDGGERYGLGPVPRRWACPHSCTRAVRVCTAAPS